MKSSLLPNFTLLPAANEEQGRSVFLFVFICLQTLCSTTLNFSLGGRVCVAFKINTMAAECDISILLVRVTEIELVCPRSLCCPLSASVMLSVHTF